MVLFDPMARNADKMTIKLLRYRTITGPERYSGNGRGHRSNKERSRKKYSRHRLVNVINKRIVFDWTIVWDRTRIERLSDCAEVLANNSEKPCPFAKRPRIRRVQMYERRLATVVVSDAFFTTAARVYVYEFQFSVLLSTTVTSRTIHTRPVYSIPRRTFITRQRLHVYRLIDSIIRSRKSLARKILLSRRTVFER